MTTLWVVFLLLKSPTHAIFSLDATEGNAMTLTQAAQPLNFDTVEIASDVVNTVFIFTLCSYFIINLLLQSGCW